MTEHNSSSAAERSAHDRRQRRVLIGVALIFFAPLALSFYLYYGKFWHPGGRVNAGELIEPARPLPALALPLASPGTSLASPGTSLASPGTSLASPGTPVASRGAETQSDQTNPQFLKGKWTLLYVQHGRCDDECRRHLYDTRQVRLALDREMNRVQRVFIGDSDCCDVKELLAAHPDLIAIRAGPADEPLLGLLPTRSAAVNSHRVYVIDPLGNAMMFYEADARPKGMLEDMKRLLRLSSIG
jgi:cytochrome oxidase Cu insertion factor (SCO1/SenC/PrrC family)